MRWWEYLSCFNYDTIHVNGEKNQVADALSCYYKYDTIVDKYPNKESVKADELLNPNRELLPVERFVEILNNVIRQSCRLQDKPSDTVAESVALNNTNKTQTQAVVWTMKMSLPSMQGMTKSHCTYTLSNHLI